MKIKELKKQIERIPDDFDILIMDVSVEEEDDETATTICHAFDIKNIEMMGSDKTGEVFFALQYSSKDE